MSSPTLLFLLLRAPIVLLAALGASCKPPDDAPVTEKSHIVSQKSAIPSEVFRLELSKSPSSYKNEFYERIINENNLDGLSMTELTKKLEGFENPSYGEKQIISAILLTIARIDPREALVRLLQVDGLSASRWIATPVLNEIATNDPNTLSSWINNGISQSSAENKEIARDAIISLSAYAPEVGFEVCRSQPGNRELLSSYFFRIGARDPEKSIELSKQLPAEAASLAIISAANGLSMTKPLEGLQLLIEERAAIQQDSSSFIKALRNQVIAASVSNSKEVIDELEKLNPKLLQVCLSNQEVMTKLASSNPENIIPLLSSIIPTKSNEQIFLNASIGIARESPEVALDWASSFPESKIKANIIRRTLQVWSGNDPKQFSLKVDSFSGTTREIALNSLSSNWGASDVSEAIDWAATLPPNEKENFQRNALVSSGYGNPKETLRLLNEISTESASLRESVNRSVASGLVKDSPIAAMEWAENLPSAERPAVTRKIIEDLAGYQPEVAGNWLLNMPAGPNRDEGIKAFISEIRPTDENAANKWQTLLDNSNIP